MTPLLKKELIDRLRYIASATEAKDFAHRKSHLTRYDIDNLIAIAETVLVESEHIGDLDDTSAPDINRFIVNSDPGPTRSSDAHVMFHGIANTSKIDYVDTLVSNFSIRIAEYCNWEPQADIDAYELALCLPVLMYGTTHGLTHDMVLTLDEPLQRHFRKL